MNEHAPKTIQEISCKEAQEMVAAGKAVFLDVRERHEYLEGHLEDVPLLPSSKITWTPVAVSFLEHDHIILLCRNGWRSRIVGETLYENGFEGTLYNLTEGLMGWQEQGFPVVGTIV